MMYEASVRDNALLSFTSELLGEVQSMDKLNRHSFTFYVTAIPVLTT